MDDSELLAITLYVPDATIRVSSRDAGFRGVILEGATELDFLHLGWWEGSHTARLAPWRGADSVVAQENFERVIGEFKPDVVITLAELWAIDWLPAHPVRPRFKWIGYFPLDGGPFYPPWEPILKDADEVVAMSEFGREVFQTGVPSKRIHRIYHGVDPEVFRPLPERDQLKGHERFRGKFVVGCVARNQPRKNIPALVKVRTGVEPERECPSVLTHEPLRRGL